MADLFANFRVLNVDVAAARLPTRLDPQLRHRPLQSEAGNLADFLFYLSRRGDVAFDRLVEDARVMIPGLQDLKFQGQDVAGEVGGSAYSIALLLQEQGLRNQTELADASFGTICALALLAMLYDPEPPLLTCVEEIDHGLHPYALDVLVDRLREAATRTQFLLATHSPTLVNRLTPEELIVCERDDRGRSRIPAIDSQSLRRKEAAARGELRLGELWFSGSLGGVPR